MTIYTKGCLSDTKVEATGADDLRRRWRVRGLGGSNPRGTSRVARQARQSVRTQVVQIERLFTVSY